MDLVLELRDPPHQVRPPAHELSFVADLTGWYVNRFVRPRLQAYREMAGVATVRLAAVHGDPTVRAGMTHDQPDPAPPE